MTYWDQWQRGALILLVVGLASFAAAISGGLIGAVVFIVLEMLWHRSDWGDLENRYLIWFAVIAVVALAPKYLADMADRGDLLSFKRQPPI